MKLSEALTLRSKLQKRIEQLQEFLNSSVMSEDGIVHSEKPQSFLLEFERLTAQLSTLTYRIDCTNLSTHLNEMTLKNALVQRDVLALRISMLKALAEAVSIRIMNYNPSDVRSVPTIDIPSIRLQIDALSKQYRELDTDIQTSNCMTDLVEI